MTSSMKNTSLYSEDEIDLILLVKIFINYKLTIVISTLIIFASALAYSFYLPNIYRAVTIVTPSEGMASSGSTSLGGQLGSLASIAGIDLRTDAQSVNIALETLKSRKFAINFIKQHQILVPLLAASHWDQNNNKLIIDPNIYNQESKQWNISKFNDRMPQPSDWNAYEKFQKALRITPNDKTQTYGISIEHKSPFVASQWLSWLIEDINSEMRNKDIEQAKSNIAFLEKELSKTAITGMQQMYYQIIEKQTQKIMLAHSNPNYVFDIIDPPAAPQKHYKPNRILLATVGLMLGFVFGCLLAVVRHYHSGEKLKNT